MTRHGYTIFEPGIGRGGVAWGELGIVGVQLPETREIETRRGVLQQYPEARELHPSASVELAIEGITALLRGQPADLSHVRLDMSAIKHFNQRVYALTRAIPYGETR